MTGTMRIERGIEWFTVDAGPLDSDLTEDNQCARCGSSVAFVECWDCGGEGEIVEHDTEDFGDEYTRRRCNVCFGRRGWWHCISTPEYCEGHPLPGREHIDSTALKSGEWE